MNRNETGGAAGAVIGTVAAVLAVGWFLQASGEMSAEAFFQSIADWLTAAFTWLFG